MLGCLPPLGHQTAVDGDCDYYPPLSDHTVTYDAILQTFNYTLTYMILVL